MIISNRLKPQKYFEGTLFEKYNFESQFLCQFRKDGFELERFYLSWIKSDEVTCVMTSVNGHWL